MTREEVIKNLIRQKGMSVKTFSEFAGIPYTTLHSMLDRGIGKAAVDNVLIVCKALGVTVEEIENMAKEADVEIHTLAAHATEDLTEEEQQEVLKFVKFLKSKRSHDEE